MSLESPRFKKWEKNFHRFNLKSLPECTSVFSFKNCFNDDSGGEDQNLYSTFHCSFNITDSNILNVFGGFQYHLFPSESAEIRRLPCGYVCIWRLDDSEEKGFVENVHFTYSGVPFPTWSVCGNVVCCIGNNSHNAVALLGYYYDEDYEKTFETIEVKCQNGNLSGRMKLISVHLEYAVTSTDMTLSGNLDDLYSSIWKVQTDNRLTLKHAWRKRFVDMFGWNQELDIDIYVICCHFSTDGGNVAFLMSNAHFFVLDLVAQSTIFEGNFRELVGVQSGNVANFFYHPSFRSRFLSFGLQCKCYSLDITTRRINCIINYEEPIIVSYTSYSKDGEFFSTCTLPLGIVFIHSTKERYLLLYKLNAYPNLANPLKVNCCDFSSSSDEVAVTYNNGDIRIWQLPRLLNLKLLCRICILRFVNGDDINCLSLPKKLKDFLRFIPSF